MYLNNTFTTFFDDLSSDKSSPGGGSVTAVTGVQSISLVTMVARLTVGKKKYEDVQEEIQEIISKGDSIKESLMKKIEEDVSVFQEIMDCYKIPKEEREKPLQSALKKSALFSFSMIEDGLETIKLAKRIGEIGNKNLISDAAIAVILSISTIETAIINVRINLKPLKDENLVQDIESKMKSILREAKEIEATAKQIIGQSIEMG